MKNVIIILALGFIGISANLENDTKIAFVSRDYVVERMDETIEMNKYLDRYAAKQSMSQDGELGKINDNIKGLKKVISQPGDEAQKHKAELKLADLTKQRQKHLMRDDKDFLEKKKEFLKRIDDELQKTLNKVARERGYKYVLNSQDGNGSPILLMASKSDDITAEVLLEMGIKEK